MDLECHLAGLEGVQVQIAKGKCDAADCSYYDGVAHL